MLCHVWKWRISAVSQATVKKATAGYWLLCAIGFFSRVHFFSQHLKSFLLWVVNTCCDWSSDRERNCLSNLWDAFFCGFDTKTIFNSVDNKQQKTLRILGVKIQIRLSEFNLWIFCSGHQVKDLGLLRPRAKNTRTVVYW